MPMLNCLCKSLSLLLNYTITQPHSLKETLHIILGSKYLLVIEIILSLCDRLIILEKNILKKLMLKGYIVKQLFPLF